jgi:tetratricopeptide (TPR) repeat protein
MKLRFPIIFVILLVPIIFIGCATTEEKLLNQGISFAKKGQYDQSIAYYNKAIEINPLFAEAYYNRGVSHDAKGQYDKAIADYTMAIERYRNLIILYINRIKKKA